MPSAKRTDPNLWERVKAEVTAGEKGRHAGEWSARKAQMAMQEYKRRGGGYDDGGGPKQEETSLHHWTEEDSGTKSGHESGEKGERYLHYDVWMLLTEDEYARTTRRKRGGREQFVDQPADVRDKGARVRREDPSRAILEARAADLGIEGRGHVDEEALLDAFRAATDSNGCAKMGRAALVAMSRADLLGLARDRGVEGRSRMTKEILVRALGG